MATISLQDIRKTYAGGVEAVKGISLDIADGELVVLMQRWFVKGLVDTEK